MVKRIIAIIIMILPLFTFSQVDARVYTEGDFRTIYVKEDGETISIMERASEIEDKGFMGNYAKVHSPSGEYHIDYVVCAIEEPALTVNWWVDFDSDGEYIGRHEGYDVLVRIAPSDRIKYAVWKAVIGRDTSA